MIISILLVIIATLVLLTVGKAINKINIRLSGNDYIDFQIKYQLVLLFSAFLLLFINAMFTKSNFWPYLAIGDVNAVAEKMALFGIQQGDRWVQTGLSLSVVITLVTGIFMYFQLKRQQVKWNLLFSGMGWILLFALTNALGEELIYRVGIVVPLQGLLAPVVIYGISAVLFGIPHYWGMPSGVIGAFLAGVLGYVLAKSVHETQGIFWAWVIHFLQDVVIIGAAYLGKGNKEWKQNKVNT